MSLLLFYKQSSQTYVLVSGSIAAISSLTGEVGLTSSIFSGSIAAISSLTGGIGLTSSISGQISGESSLITGSIITIFDKYQTCVYVVIPVGYTPEIYLLLHLPDDAPGLCTLLKAPLGIPDLFFLDPAGKVMTPITMSMPGISIQPPSLLAIGEERDTPTLIVPIGNDKNVGLKPISIILKVTDFKPKI